MKTNRLKILGVPVDSYDSTEELLRDIEVSMIDSKTRTIFSVNPEKVMRARKDPLLFEALNNSDFLIPDGIGVVFAIKFLYKKMVTRIAGVDLMRLLLRNAEKKGYRVYIFGARPDVNKKAIDTIKENFFSLTIAGSSHGYINDDHHESLIDDINSTQPDILFVGLGSPKQENWIFDHKHLIKVKLCMGIGGSLDVIAGHIKRAPSVLRRLGLEWLYRLLREPSRFRRQLVLPQFFFEVLKKVSSDRSSS